MTKSELRNTCLKRQTDLSEPRCAEMHGLIAEQFFAQTELNDIRHLHTFLPIERFNEIDTHVILEKLWTDFPYIETVAPRVNQETGEIENLKYDRETEMTLSKWQIHEPAHNEIVKTEKVDLFIVPLLCFDERGYRVGYGKGFYDRLLAKARPDALKVGLSYFPPVAEITDVNEFDIRLSVCVTPDKVWRF